MPFTIGEIGHVIEHNTIANTLLNKVNTADNDAAIAGHINTAGTSATKTALTTVLNRRGWLASDHGVIGDGIADDAPALAALLTNAAAAGATVILAANSVISIKSRLYPPSNTRIDGQGATLRNDMTASTSDALMWLSNVTNILIERLNIDGNKAAYATATEWKHGISMTQASRVTLRDVTSNRNKGDGVYVGGTVTTYCSDIVLERVTCDENHRQGLSIVSVIGFEASNCKFTRTAGTNPQCGLDIEPNTADAPVDRIKFTACEFTGNTMQGIAVAAWATRTINQGGVDFVGCSVDGNLGGGVKLITGDGIRFLGGSIKNNTGHGVWFSAASGKTTDVQFNGTNITGNTTKGMLMDTECQGLTLTAVRAYGNTTAAASIGVDLAPVVAVSNIKILGCTFGGATQTHGLRTGSNVSNLTLVGNTYLDAPTPVSLSDDVATRVRVEGTGGNLITATTTRSATGSVGAGFRSTTDTFDKVLLRTDGLLTFGSGTVAVDTQLSRVVANVLGTGTDDCFRTGLALTASRPSASAVGAGAQFFDSTLNRPIWSDGTGWRDAAGVAV